MGPIRLSYGLTVRPVKERNDPSLPGWREDIKLVSSVKVERHAVRAKRRLYLAGVLEEASASATFLLVAIFFLSIPNVFCLCWFTERLRAERKVLLMSSSRYV